MSSAYGYSLGPMCIALCEDKYAMEAARIDGHVDAIERSKDHLTKLTALLTEIHTAQQVNKDHIDLSQHKDLISEVRGYSSSLARVFPEGVYEWHNRDAIQLLTSTLSESAKTVASIANPEMMYVNQGLTDISELIKVFTKIVESSTKPSERSVNNQTK